MFSIFWIKFFFSSSLAGDRSSFPVWSGGFFRFPLNGRLISDFFDRWRHLFRNQSTNHAPGWWAWFVPAPVGRQIGRTVEGFAALWALVFNVDDARAVVSGQAERVAERQLAKPAEVGTDAVGDFRQACPCFLGDFDHVEGFVEVAAADDDNVVLVGRGGTVGWNAGDDGAGDWRGGAGGGFFGGNVGLLAAFHLPLFRTLKKSIFFIWKIFLFSKKTFKQK